MPDKDGYPTKEELNKIKDWSLDSLIEDPLSLIRYIGKLWFYPDRIVIQETEDPIMNRKEYSLYLSTGGWSGNESIIEALAKNIFWQMYWVKTEVGGHYWFKIFKIENYYTMESKNEN